MKYTAVFLISGRANIYGSQTPLLLLEFAHHEKKHSRWILFQNGTRKRINWNIVLVLLSKQTVNSKNNNSQRFCDYKRLI